MEQLMYHRTKFHKLFTLLIFSLSLLLLTSQKSFGAPITLTWDGNEEPNLAGYMLYYGTSPGNYLSPIDVGNVTTYELSGLTDGTTYYIALTAYDTHNEESEKTDEVSVSVQPLDPHTPIITITSPTSLDTFSTAGATISIAGSASDSVTIVTWENNRGGSGTASGTTSWSVASINLQIGQNLITITGRDAAGNTCADSLTANCLSCEDPQKLQPVSITASSESKPFWQKYKVTDGNLRTSWSPAPKLSWNDEFITLDFGEITQLSRVDMYASKLFNLDFLPLNFQIQISKDNLNWEEIHTENNYKLHSVRSDSWDFNNYQARYVRIYITKAKSFFIFFRLIQIAEIEVYGCDIPEQNLASGDEDKKSEDNNPDETGDILESAQGLPGVPGKPVITFY